MQIAKLLLFTIIISTTISCAAHVVKTNDIEKTVSKKPTYGKSKQDLSDFFTNNISKNLLTEKYTKAIFRLLINAEGQVIKVESIATPYNQEEEEQVLELIRNLKWNQMYDKASTYLIVEIKDNVAKVELR